MNPVLRKDLLGLLRLKRVAAVQVFFVAVLALLVMATWPQSGVLHGAVPDNAGPDAMAPAAVESQPSLIRTNDQLLVGLVIGEIIMMILFVPGIAAVAITGEKEANTLEMLYASRLKPREIIAGKIALAVGYPVLLLIFGLPFLALLSWRGDVPPADLGWAVAVLAVTAVYLSMLSLMISALCRTSATALVMAYLVVLGLCGATLVPAAIMLHNQSGEAAAVLHYIRAVSPVAAALSRFRGAYIDFGPAREMYPISAVFMPVALLTTLACALLLAARLRSAPSASEGFRSAGGADGGGERTLGRKLIFLIDPKKRRKPFGRFNPVISKERRTGALASGRWMIRIFYGALALSMGLALMSLYGGTQYTDLLGYVAAVLIASQMALIALVTPSLSSAAISGELENGTFETLRLSRLNGRQIFWGKFLPAFGPAVLPVIALLPAYATLWYVNPGYLAHLQRIAPIVLLAVVLCCTIGLMCSAFSAQTARATVAAYLITAGLFVLPLFGWWAGGEQISQSLGAKIAAVSPLAMALNLLPHSSVQIMDMYHVHLYLIAGLCVAMVIVSRIRLSVLLRRGE